jgi:hypothetical protein
LPHTYYISCQSYPAWLDHSNYTWRRVQVMKLLIMQFYAASCHLISSVQIFSSPACSESLSGSVPSPPYVRDQVSHPYKTT